MICLNFISACIFLIAVTGCAFLPGEPPINGTAEPVDGTGQQDQEDIIQESPEQEPEDIAEQIIEQVAEEEAAPVETEQNLTNETNQTEELEISGSLDLQEDLSLCPHLAPSFECDKYDIRRCEFKTSVGRNNFYPDLINCRDGDPDKGEDAGNKYCIIQACQPLAEDNMVYAYGGPTAYAEYDHTVHKTETGIMTQYDLLRCGEMHEEFETKFDCTVYKAELDGLWVN